MRCALVSSLLLVIASVPVAPQVARTTTTGVVVDVTVLDRDGRPVLDLKPDEFELSEDGKRQQVLAVSLVHAGLVRPLDVPVPAAVTDPGRASIPGFAAPRTAQPETTPTVTAILFDRLSPEMRPLAHQAAATYLATLSPPHDYAGIFLANVNLVTFASFTNEPEALRTALDRMGATAATHVSAATERASYPRVQNLPLDPNQPVTPGAESGTGWINPADRKKYLTGSDPETRLRVMELRMYETYQQFLSEFEGQSSLAGLRSIVAAMALLPGRKSVVYFCEQLPITDRIKPKFDALIHEANRNNISFYTVDAAGLRVHSEEAKVARNVELAGSQGIGDTQRGSGAWTKELERQEQLLSSRAGVVLGRLAKETGGFLLDNTNDLGKGVSRMQQERTTYYLLGYEPTNTAADGKFRRVTVKVKRPRTTVRARPGYVAAPQPR